MKTVVKPALILGCLLPVLTMAACENAPTEPDPADTNLGTVLTFAATTPPTAGVPGEFHIERDCPAGGKVVIDSNFSFETDQATGLLHSEWDSEQTFHGCTFASQQNGKTHTSDGTISTTGHAVHEPPAQSGGVARLLENEVHQVGRLTFTYDGESRTCDIDVTVTIDADEGTARVTGLQCGKRIDVKHRLPQI
jgi:hypothetical protein